MINHDDLPNGQSKQELIRLLQEIIEFIGTKDLGPDLERDLMESFGPASSTYQRVTQLLRQGIEEGWACYKVIDGPDYCRGRLGVSSLSPHEFVIESARLRNVKGNYHTHTLGEINMIQPVDSDATFCGTGAGWKVFAPGTSHYPTVTGGTCTFVFFLPKGAIEYHDEH